MNKYINYQRNQKAIDIYSAVAAPPCRPPRRAPIQTFVLVLITYVAAHCIAQSIRTYYLLDVETLLAATTPAPQTIYGILIQPWTARDFPSRTQGPTEYLHI